MKVKKLPFLKWLSKNDESAPPAENSYFTLAKSWSDDFYASTEASRNRWKAVSLWFLFPLSILLACCVAALIPAQHLVPLMVEHYSNGLVSITPFKQPYAPMNQAQVENDIAHYVQFRESYSLDGYDYRYRLMRVLSSSDVFESYLQRQDPQRETSPIHQLGNKGYRTVQIESIVFLDGVFKNGQDGENNKHHNLAQINFLLTEVNKVTGTRRAMPKTVLVSWNYRGMPKNPGDRWMNWNGFEITRYDIQTRAV